MLGLGLDLSLLRGNRDFSFTPSAMQYHPDKSFSVAAQETGPTSVIFNPTFTEMCVTGTISDFARTYTGITETNLSGATYDAAKSSSYGAASTNPTCHVYMASGTKVCFTGLASDSFNTFTLTTPYNLGVKTYQAGQSASHSAQEPNGRGIDITPDGTFMMLTGDNDIIYGYDLSTPDNPATRTYNAAKSFNMTAFCGRAESCRFVNSGKAILVCDSINHMIHFIELATAYNPSTGTYRADKSLHVGDFNTYPSDATFNADGTVMYMVGATNAGSQYAGVYVFMLTPYTRPEVSLLDYIDPAEHAAIIANTSTFDATADFAEFMLDCTRGGKNGYIPAGRYNIGTWTPVSYNWFGHFQLRGDGAASNLLRPAASVAANFQRRCLLQSFRGTISIDGIKTDSQQATQSLGTDPIWFGDNRQQCHEFVIEARPPPQNNTGINVNINNYTCDNPIGAGINIASGSHGGFCNSLNVTGGDGGGIGRPFFRGDIEVTSPFNYIYLDVEGATYNSIVFEIEGVDFTKQQLAVVKNVNCRTELNFVQDCGLSQTPFTPTCHFENITTKYIGINGGIITMKDVVINSELKHLQLSKCNITMDNVTINHSAAQTAAIDFGYEYQFTADGLTITGNSTYAIHDQNEQDSVSYMRLKNVTTPLQIRLRSGEFSFENCNLTYSGPNSAIFQFNTNRLNMGTKQNSISLVNNYHPNDTLYEWDGVGDNPNLTESGNYQ